MDLQMLKSFLTLIFLLLSQPSASHDQWADGSLIPSWIKAACCGPADAHHLTPHQVHRTDDGFYIVDGYTNPDGTLRPISPREALPSQDGDYWIFYRRNAYGPGIASKVYCFFVPMNF